MSGKSPSKDNSTVRWYRYNGLMIVAALLFLSLLVPDGPDPMAPIGEAILQNRNDLALRQLEGIRQDSPGTYKLNHLPYLEAVLLSREGRIEEANPILECLLKEDFLLKDFVLRHLIRNLDNQPLSVSQPYFEDFLSHHTSHPEWTATALLFAERLEDAGEYGEAKTWYDRVWRSGKRSLSREAALGHALLHLKTSEETETVRDLHNLIRKNDKDDVAYQSLLTLEVLEPLETLNEAKARQAAQVCLNNRDSRRLRTYLRYLIDKYPKSPARDLYGYMMGRSYVFESDYALAVEAYDKNYELFPKTSWGIFSGYVTANTALRGQDYEGAEQRYRRFLKDHPTSQYVDKAQFNLVETLHCLKRIEDAEEEALKALAKATGKRKRPFHYALVRLYLDQEDYSEALASLERLDHLTSAQLPSGVTREEIYFWKGACLQQLNRQEEAARAFQEGSKGSLNYFAYLSKSRLRPEEIPDDPAPTSSWNQDLLAPREYRFSEQEAGEPTGKMTRLARIRELLFLRLYDEAALEISMSSSASFGNDRTKRLYNLAYYAAKGGHAGISTRAANRIRLSSFRRARPEAYPPELAWLFYPRHYWDEVIRFSNDFDVNPDLVLSVIRRESVFQEDAKSPAAARGLMQFMYPIALELAGEMGIPEPTREDLYRPELSIQLGCYQIRRMLDRFDGSVEKALAAYNGAPDNVERWAAKLSRPNDAPLFVTNIGFRETKLYVLKVLGDYHSYRAVHGDQPSRSAAAGY